MKITMTGRGLQVHETVREYAEQKAAKLERYLDELQKVEIVLSAEGDRKTVEMLAVPRKGAQIVGQSSHDDMFAAIDLVIDKMYQQLHKLKEKRDDRRKRSERVPAPPLPSDMVQDEQLETYDEVVEKFSEKLEQ